MIATIAEGQKADESCRGVEIAVVRTVVWKVPFCSLYVTTLLVPSMNYSKTVDAFMREWFSFVPVFNWELSEFC